MKKLLISAVLLGATSTHAAAADVSANGGFVTEYIFRGVPQTDGKAAAQVGLDIEQSGLYLGSWASTVDGGDDAPDGLEVDLYGGYGGEIGEFSYDLGATWYQYTEDFDDDYVEVNLSGTWSFLTLDVALGRYSNFDGPTLDYHFYSVAADYNGFYGLVGTFGNDFDGEYFEAGYGNALTIDDLDLFTYRLSVIYSNNALLGGDDDTFLILSLTKTFRVLGN